MKTLNQIIMRAQTKASRESLRVVKQLQHRIKNSSDEGQQILFIVGCQRSGTSMITKIFENDMDTRVFYEFSSLSSQDKIKGLRLNALDDVAMQIKRSKSPLVISKPLVESQRIDSILESFPTAKAMWMYRHYTDVVSSNLKRWGPQNGISDIRYIALEDKANWRSEGASPEVTRVIKNYFSEKMNPHDAAALFWYARNALFFDLSLSYHCNVALCKYEELVKQPDIIMTRLYQYLDRPYPGAQITQMVSGSSVGKGRNVDLSPEIESLCADMLVKLDEAYHEYSVLSND